ncbi:hypothetical protein A4R26_23085 [Niastella populi]|uniref:Uncharacterized protein n=1 Tax=Niastella populi TaxID=550983 RepID=A0A1V9FHY6_9BACT|nr:hypothetical protein A4R26_23085 [Niastella populi]
MRVKNTLLRAESYNVSRQDGEKVTESMKHKRRSAHDMAKRRMAPGLTGWLLAYRCYSAVFFVLHTKETTSDGTKNQPCVNQ